MPSYVMIAVVRVGAEVVDDPVVGVVALGAGGLKEDALDVVVGAAEEACGGGAVARLVDAERVDELVVARGVEARERAPVVHDVRLARDGDAVDALARRGVPRAHGERAALVLLRRGVAAVEPRVHELLQRAVLRARQRVVAPGRADIVHLAHVLRPRAPRQAAEERRTCNTV